MGTRSVSEMVRHTLAKERTNGGCTAHGGCLTISLKFAFFLPRRRRAAAAAAATTDYRIVERTHTPFAVYGTSVQIGAKAVLFFPTAYDRGGIGDGATVCVSVLARCS